MTLRQAQGDAPRQAQEPSRGQQTGGAWRAPSRLDRVEELRGDGAWVEAQWDSPGARVLPVTSEGEVAWTEGALGYSPARGKFSGEHLLLGLQGGVPVFAERVAGLTDAAPLRSVMDGLEFTDLEVAFTAAALAGWHGRAAYCGVCGAATRSSRGGYARSCTGCGRELYPRVDPAVIVAITDASDRLLLGRQPVWPKGRVSVLAGFVTAGESLEQTVHREVAEEVGLQLSGVRYLGSQPWPFPRSIMVAFAARAEGTRLTLEPSEIEEARWFTRAELAAGLASGAVALPMKTSIAHRMISAWREQRL